MKDIKLDKPGAGLPKLELFFIRIIFYLFVRFNSLSKVKKIFLKETSNILDILNNSNLDFEKQVLINRIKGLEDSSRNWSVYMTIAHINIVNSGASQIVLNLLDNKTIDQVVRTADVKPKISTNSLEVENFKIINKKVIKLFDLEYLSEKTHKHPWFGKMNAKSWAYLIVIHLKIHRKQIEAILKNQEYQ